MFRSFRLFARFLFPPSIIVIAILLTTTLLRAQEFEQPGHSIGKVSVLGHLILMELNPGAFGQQNLFNLDGRTLRFTPTRAGYRVENLPLQWDANFGEQIKDPNVALRNFSFPFSGKSWDAISVGATGSIRFGPPERNPFAFEGAPAGFRPRDFGGISVARFAQLSEGAGDIVNTVPAICVFFKPRMSGERYATELAAKDAVIGFYPLVSTATEKNLAALAGRTNPSVAANLDIRNLKLSAVGDLFLKVTFETSAPVLPKGNPSIAGISYRVHFSAPESSAASSGASASADWRIFGFAPRNRNSGSTPRYVVFGPGLSRHVDVSGNNISIEGLLPSTLRDARELTVSADSYATISYALFCLIQRHAIVLKGIRNPEVHFSSLKPNAGPFPVVYEAFHYYALPNNRDLSCTVIKALGDKFDFLAYYSDFRVDNQEAGTPSDGPLGSTGPAVTGIAATQTKEGLASYCTKGRFQWG